ncbi:MAG: hypothetical protein ACK501_17935 [Planctomycetota bacterium]|jgi:hypothetical protein
MSLPNPTVQVESTSDYVLPSPPRGTGEIVVVAPPGDGASSLSRGAEVARRLGARFAALGESQQLFLGELRERIVAIDGGVAEASRAQLKGALRELLAVLDWCDAVQADTLQDAARAADGEEPIDLGAFAEDVVVPRLGLDRPVLVTGRTNLAVWGRASQFADLIRHGVELLAERAAGQGAIGIDIDDAAGAPRIRFSALGEPADAIEPAVVRRFRATVDLLGATVLPGEHGVGGTACVVALPA